MTGPGGNMPRWNALSDELDPSLRELVTRLRRLKDRSELSMRQLAARTGYSVTSWERYLGGRSLPPGRAVEALARIGGADPVGLLALHEVAAEAWAARRAKGPAPARLSAGERTGPAAEREPAGPAAPAEPPAPVVTATAADAPSTGRALHVALVAGAVALVLALSAVFLLVLRFHPDSGATAATAPLPSAAESSSPPAYTCRIERTEGLWTAGINSTRDTEVSYGDVGPDVAEAQCLLRRAGISPGGIDGMFGPLTLRAVKDMQKKSGLVVDGMVGPRTWKALRG